MAKLSDSRTDVQNYKSSCYQLGVELSNIIWNNCVFPKGAKIMLACSSEDADWLAKGILDELLKHEVKISLAVFWNLRSEPFDNKELTVAPILKSYIERSDSTDFLIICKSIISSSCVVRTNLTYLIEDVNPGKILIASPVLLDKAIGNLKFEFPERISKKFDFFYFATDNEINGAGEVVPGIGGSVYKRLGLEDSTQKYKYVPAIVKERRAAHA